jgi:hypothetical protein
MVVYNKHGGWVTVCDEKERLSKQPEFQVWGHDFTKTTETIAAPIIIQKDIVAPIIEDRKRSRPAKAK